MRHYPKIKLSHYLGQGEACFESNAFNASSRTRMVPIDLLKIIWKTGRIRCKLVDVGEGWFTPDPGFMADIPLAYRFDQHGSFL